MRKTAAPSRSTRATRPRKDGVILGREGFAQISAVEGIELTADMRATLDRFDREGLSAEARRRDILARFTPAR